MTMIDHESYQRGADFPVQGVDVSKHQGDFDWGKSVREGKIQFGYARATATGNVDPSFDRNWWAMAEQPIMRSAYAYVRPKSEEDPKASADAFAEAIQEAERKIHGGPAMHSGTCLPPWLDLESSEHFFDDPKDNLAWVESWVTQIQLVLERPVIIYTSSHFWEGNISETAIVGSGLCVPRYTNEPGLLPVVSPWTRFTFWQWSGGGDGDMFRALTGHGFPGVVNDGSVDVDAFAGDADMLHALAEPMNDMFWTRDGLVTRQEYFGDPSPPGPECGGRLQHAEMLTNCARRMISMSSELNAMADDLLEESTRLIESERTIK